MISPKSYDTEEIYFPDSPARRSVMLAEQFNVRAGRDIKVGQK